MVYHVPQLYQLLSERRRFIASYVQPILQQYESTTVSAIKETPMKITSHHVPIIKSTFFAVNKDEWDTKEGP